MMWSLEFKKEFEDYIKQFKVLLIIQYCDYPLSTHYHFKKRKDMKLAMHWNANPWDTFSYAGKEWKEKTITKEWLIESRRKWEE